MQADIEFPTLPFIHFISPLSEQKLSEKEKNWLNGCNFTIRQLNALVKFFYKKKLNSQEKEG